MDGYVHEKIATLYVVGKKEINCCGFYHGLNGSCIVSYTEEHCKWRWIFMKELSLLKNLFNLPCRENF